jgi:hypothetical protein
MARNGRINVKEAVRIAVEYVRDLYAPAQLDDLRLEEVGTVGRRQALVRHARLFAGRDCEPATPDLPNGWDHPQPPSPARS